MHRILLKHGPKEFAKEPKGSFSIGDDMITKYTSGDIIYVPLTIKSAMEIKGKIYYEACENDLKNITGSSLIPEEGTVRIAEKTGIYKPMTL